MPLKSLFCTTTIQPCPSQPQEMESESGASTYRVELGDSTIRLPCDRVR